MRVYRRRRVFTIIVFLGVIGLIFLSFQVLSVQVLNHEAGEQLVESQDERELPHQKPKPDIVKKPTPKVLTKAQREARKNAIAKVIADLDEKTTKKPKLRDIIAENKRRELEEDAHRNRVELEVRQLRERVVGDAVKSLRGVSPRLIKLYHESKKGTFTCIHSGEVIPHSRVNDDYCDCKDGTDEPGTSACRNGRFYCHFQLDQQNLVWFPASKVNDGICDCCDASDEWDAPTLPSDVALHDGKPAYGVYQWPCPDSCHNLVEQMLFKKDVHDKGAVVRRQYIAEAKGKPNPNGVYGNQGEFFPLSKSCFYMDSDKYGYDICPFQEARQKFQGASRIIGRNQAEWAIKGPSQYVLKMTNGDSNQCPSFKSRITWVNFICGVDNKVLSVQETEICEYTVKFETPAACSDDVDS